MVIPIVLISSDSNFCHEMTAMLEKQLYSPCFFSSLQEFETYPRIQSFPAIILDLDTVTVEKYRLKSLRKRTPSLFIIGVSKRSFHPELEEEMRSHIYACLNKPVDPDELTFWLRSIIKERSQEPIK